MRLTVIHITETITAAPGRLGSTMNILMVCFLLQQMLPPLSRRYIIISLEARTGMQKA